jgi:diguanylate cyclase (GGDEF)-like protein
VALVFLSVVTILQIAGLIAVHVAGRGHTRRQIGEEILVAGRVFERLLEVRDRQLADGARVAAADPALRAAAVALEADVARRALEAHRARLSAQLAMLIAPDGRPAIDASHAGPGAERPSVADVALMVREARGGRRFVTLGREVYQVGLAPVPSPPPVPTLLMGFRIDDAFAADLQSFATAYVSFVRREVTGGVVTAGSTLPASVRPSLGAWMKPGALEPGVPGSVAHGSEEFVSLAIPVDRHPRGILFAVVQRQLGEAMAPFSRLQVTLLGLSLLGLLVSVAAALWLGRSVSRPLLVLAEGARRIEEADYGHRVTLEQQDELGALATAFNSMAKGLAEREAKLRFQAYHDLLTGLPNRALFSFLLQQTILVGRRERRRCAVLLLDLDRFKEVNDTLGHDTGDELLQELGRRFRRTMRESDTIARFDASQTVARFGGDEFAMLLPSVNDVADALVVVQKLRHVLEEPFRIGDQPLELNASVGVALYPDHGEDPSTLIRRADVAMYAAKRGSAGYAVYATEMDEGSPRRLTLVGELRHAIEQEALVLHYQPKIRVATDQVTECEALVRWGHPREGLVPPGDFVPLAEQSGTIKPLTLWVVRTALRECARWRAGGLSLGVTVNVSARVLDDAQFADQVAEALAASGIPATALVIEITETAIMADPGTARAALTRLDALGLRLSVDDFGIGHSSLAYLRDLPVDELKIDRSFVMEMESSNPSAVIVRSTVELAHNLGLEVTAEGVESPGAYRALKALGCDLAQGYFISRPLSADDLASWLRESRWSAGRPARLAGVGRRGPRAPPADRG